MTFEEGGKVKMEEIKAGVRVEYHPVGGSTGTATSTGIVKDVLKEPESVGGRQTVNASEEEPRIVIENENTHKETAYKLMNIVKVL